MAIFFITKLMIMFAINGTNTEVCLNNNKSD